MSGVFERLPLLEIALSFGLLRQRARSDAPAPFAFAWEDKPSIVVRGDRFFHDDLGLSGDLLDLAVLHLSGGVHEPSRRAEAREWLFTRASEPTAWSHIEARAQHLRANPGGRRRWADALVASIEKPSGQLAPNVAEARRLLDALGMDWERWSICMLCYGNEAMLCWMPAVPWLGLRVMRKESGYYGGWTRHRAFAQHGDRDAGLVYCVDFDGDPRHGLPSMELLLRLVDTLAERGMPYTAFVISSFGQAPNRAKAHLYFRATTRADAERDFIARHAHIDFQIAQIVESWVEVNALEKLRLARDVRTNQLTRLIRLPGFNKRTGGQAAVLLAAHDGARVDFDHLLQERPTRVEESWSGGRQRIWEFGPQCRILERRQEGQEVTTREKHLGFNLWPTAHTRDVETGELGVRYRFRDAGGHIKHGILPARSWSDAAIARHAASTMVGRGVQAKPGHGPDLVMAIGQWATQSSRNTVMPTTSRPGWLEGSYINGSRAHGCGHLWHGAPWRGEQRGELFGLRDGVEAHLRASPLYMFAFGVALAGALVGRIGADSFWVHLDAPCEKVLASAVRTAASVWHAPHRAPNVRDYYVVRAFDGACLPLMTRAPLPTDVLEALMHARAPHPFANPKRRVGPSVASAHPLQLSLLSAGRDALPEHAGPDARPCLILELAAALPGLTDAAGLTALNLELDACYGVAGDTFARHLTRVGASGARRLAVELDQTLYSVQKILAPAGARSRASRVLSTVAVALTEAHAAGIWPSARPFDDAISVVRWALEHLHTPPQSPESTTWATLSDLRATTPAAFPLDPAAMQNPHCVGLAAVNPASGELAARVFTTVAHLDRWTAQARCDVDGTHLLAWAQSRGFAARSGEEGWWLLDSEVGSSAEQALTPRTSSLRSSCAG